MTTEQSTGETEQQQLAPEVDNEVDTDQEDEIELAENPHEEGQKILKQLAEEDRDNIFAAVSGGDDSIVALYFAYLSPHIELDGILHIDTGIGIPETREYVEEIAEDLGLKCYTVGEGNIRYPHESYSYLVTKFGFPGANPIAHSQVQSNLKDKPFNRFESYINGDIALISGVRKAESNRRYDKLRQLAENGINEVKQILWVSPIVEFDEKDLKEFKEEHDIKENMVSAMLNSSGECLCAYEDRQRLETLKEFYPEVAQKIFKLEFDVLEEVARGNVPREYALWAHGSMDKGEFEKQSDSTQAQLLCADCENSCGTAGYDMTEGEALSPAEEFIKNNDLNQFWNVPFYCVPCDRVIQSPLKHREECHGWDHVAGLEGYWDVRKIEFGKSDIDRVITEPNGHDMHINHLAPTKQEAVNNKHHGFHENYAVSHCDNHDHEWHDHNGGPVQQCSKCFTFDLADYDPHDPGPPILNPVNLTKEDLKANKEEAEELQDTLDNFRTSSTRQQPENPLTRSLERM